jgi:hypothetical protein
MGGRKKSSESATERAKAIARAIRYVSMEIR